MADRRKDSLAPVPFIHDFAANLLHGKFLSPWFKPALVEEGKLKIALKPETVLQMIAVEDIGKFGLLAFENHNEMNGAEIEMAGDRRTMPETAGIIGKAIGRNPPVREDPDRRSPKDERGYRNHARMVR